MTNHPAQFAFLLIAILSFPCAAVPIIQQRSAPAQIRTSERENSAREHEAERTRKRDPNEVMAEVNDDLRQLNELNEGIELYTATPNQKLSYDSIVGSTTEIKKRSTRLRTNLALPKGDSKEKLPVFEEAEQGELQAALSALNKLLDSFLHNPIFSDAGEIDMQLAARARRDLDSVVVLSEKVRKNAEKRSKLSAKTQQQ
jgi:hypothetical protein